jgi:hypothetical protein
LKKTTSGNFLRKPQYMQTYYEKIVLQNSTKKSSSWRSNWCWIIFKNFGGANNFISTHKQCILCADCTQTSLIWFP